MFCLVNDTVFVIVDYSTKEMLMEQKSIITSVLWLSLVMG